MTKPDNSTSPSRTAPHLAQGEKRVFVFFDLMEKRSSFSPRVTSLPLEKWSPSPLGSIKATLLVSDCWRHWQVHVRGTENKFRPRVGACCLPQTLNSVLWSQACMKRSGFWFQTCKFQEPSQDSNGHKNFKKIKKWKTKAHSLLMSYSKHSTKLINKV